MGVGVGVRVLVYVKMVSFSFSSSSLLLKSPECTQQQQFIKARLRWLGVFLQYPCKFVIFLLSFNILIIIIHHCIAKGGCYTMI